MGVGLPESFFRFLSLSLDEKDAQDERSSHVLLAYEALTCSVSMPQGIVDSCTSWSSFKHRVMHLLPVEREQW